LYIPERLNPGFQKQFEDLHLKVLLCRVCTAVIFGKRDLGDLRVNLYLLKGFSYFPGGRENRRGKYYNLKDLKNLYT
jgi:hypothetical protein